MGTLTITVMVALIDRGVIVLEVPAAALERACNKEPDMVLALCRTFISSYCNVLSWGFAEL